MKQWLADHPDVVKVALIVIGVVLIGCSYFLEGWIPTFWAALVSQVFWGLGYTFTSGATEAWITDEIGEDAVGPVFLRGRQMWLAGSLIGTLGCVTLGVVHVQLPMILAGVGMVALAAVMVLVMPERHMRVTPATERTRSFLLRGLRNETSASHPSHARATSSKTVASPSIASAPAGAEAPPRRSTRTVCPATSARSTNIRPVVPVPPRTQMRMGSSISCETYNTYTN